MVHMSTAHMAPHVKVATGMSPPRFWKHQRPREDRRQLSVGDATAALVAEVVGHVGASRFNREYLRGCGLAPAQDAAGVRADRRTPEALRALARGSS